MHVIEQVARRTAGSWAALRTICLLGQKRQGLQLRSPVFLRALLSGLEPPISHCPVIL